MNTLIFSVEYFHGINVVNDGVFCFPTKERLEEFLEKNYPSNLFRNKNVDKLMCEIVHKIGKSNNSILFDSFVILKLLNKTLCINQGEISGLNSMEYEFLHDSDFWNSVAIIKYVIYNYNSIKSERGQIWCFSTWKNWVIVKRIFASCFFHFVLVPGRIELS